MVGVSRFSGIFSQVSRSKRKNERLEKQRFFTKCGSSLKVLEFFFRVCFFSLLFTSHERLNRHFHISNTTKYDFRRQQKNALTAKYEPICHLNKRNAFVCQTYRMANVVFIRSLIMLGKSTWCSAKDDFLFLLFFSISWRTICFLSLLCFCSILWLIKLSNRYGLSYFRGIIAVKSIKHLI